MPFSVVVLTAVPSICASCTSGTRRWSVHCWPSHQRSSPERPLGYQPGGGDW